MPNGVKFNADYPDITESDKLYARATGLIPSYSQLIAKGPTQHVNGIAPKYLHRAKGSHVWDVDGNEFLDFNMASGPISLGYAYDRVDEAIKKQLADGLNFSLMHPLEVEVSELVRDIVPNAESVRFSKTGADVTSAAVRLARAYTGRDKVLCCGYHGWHDWYIGITTRNAGIPQAVQDLVHTFQFNDIESAKAALDQDTACVIIEPMVFAWPDEDFLPQLKALCEANGALLILDEMWTGFRLALGGAQERFGVVPDLATYSKAVANGMPISVLTGRADVMQILDESVFFYTTFGGETLSLAAMQATLLEMREKQVQAHLAEQGQKLLDGYNQIAQDLDLGYTKCIGYPARSLITFDASAGDPLLLKSLVQQEMIKRGVLWSGFHNMCFSHSDEDVDYALNVYLEVLPILKEAVAEDKVADMLRGEPVQPVFRKLSDFNMKPKK